jgi:glycosyltransferase involved in cell wall biosynthesis
MKILWLASWYPSRIDLFNGDFIQRHAQAASLHNDIEVIHVIKDEKGIVTRNYKIVETKKERLTERVVYYFAPFQNIPLAGKLYSEIKYRRIYKKEIKKYIKKQGKPDVVHVHVCMKAGVMAMWLKQRFNLAYMITEHSTEFLSEAKKRIEHYPFYFQRVCLKIFKKAAAVSVVSEHLGISMHRFLQDKEFTVIPNVVNTAIFNTVLKLKNQPIRFIHISGFNYQKNPEAILQSFAIVKATRQNFIADFFGPSNKTLIRKVNGLGLTEFVNFHAEIPQTELAGFMQKADALILYSHYETFGCVVIEANACGLPVIVSDIPAMKEIVKNNFNGILVKENDPHSLAEKIIAFIDGELQFNSVNIARHTSENYSYEKVGAALNKWYEAVLSRLKN